MTTPDPPPDPRERLDAPAAGTAGSPQRLSPLTPVVRAPLLVAAVLGGSWQQLSSGGLSASLVVLALLVVIGLAYGLASWLRTTYVVTPSELRIDRGVISRQSRRLRIDRLQGVDVVQPWLARLLGLAELRFDLASGGEREGALAFLPLRQAESLRRLLLDRRDQVRGVPETPPHSPGARTLAVVPLPRLVGSVVLSASSLALLVGGTAAVVASLVSGVPLLAGGAVPALLGAGIAVVRTFSGSYGFTVTEGSEGLQVRRGLASLSTQTIPLARVQGVVVLEPVWWRPWGWARLEVSMAGGSGGGDDVTTSSTLLPVGPVPQVRALARHVLGGEDAWEVPLRGVPARARWLAPLSAPVLAYGQGPALAVSRRGLLVRRHDAVPQGKVQSVRLVQGPLQRRLGLAEVHLDSPVGKVAVRGRLRDGRDARRLTAAAVPLARSGRRLSGGGSAASPGEPARGPAPGPGPASSV